MLFSISAIGQTDLLSKKGSCYYFNGQEYKYTELEHIYENHLPSLSLYISGVSLSKNARRNSLIALGLYGIGIASILVRTKAPLGSPGSNGLTSVGGYSLVGATMFSSIGFLQRLKSRKKLKKAMLLYNYHKIEQDGYDSNISIDLTQTANGIGLVLNF